MLPMLSHGVLFKDHTPKTNAQQPRPSCFPGEEGKSEPGGARHVPAPQTPYFGFPVLVDSDAATGMTRFSRSRGLPSRMRFYSAFPMLMRIQTVEGGYTLQDVFPQQEPLCCTQGSEQCLQD